MKVFSNEQEFQYAVEITKQRFAERNVPESDDTVLEIIRDESLVEDEFRLEDGKLYASSLLGAIHGCGRYLRGCRFAFSRGGFKASQETVSIKPAATYRGVYMASHFHNYYHVSSVEEMTRYLEDLALWGWRYLRMSFPVIDIESADDPQIDIQVERHRQIYAAARKIGMKVVVSLLVNTTYKDFPKELEATKPRDPFFRRGGSGNVVCLSKEGAREYMDGIIEDLCKRFSGFEPDVVTTWPYDEGGCGCPDCSPWGAKGYIKGAKRTFEIAKKYFPNAKRLVGTWCFDEPWEGEWEALDRSLEEEKWCDIILADAHESFPHYPLEVHVPGDLPMVTFPEISMWGLFPWGGWGATMLPQRLTELYLQVEGKAQGCLCYSEGTYEDFNKAIESQFYLTNQTDWKETARDYARYELGIADTERFIRLVELVEKTHTDVANTGRCNLKDAKKAYALAKELETMMPEWGKKCWRWRIIFIRCEVDALRYELAERKLQESIAVGDEFGNVSSDWETLLLDEPTVQKDFRELIEIFHCSETKTDDPYHARVRPMCP